MVNCNICHGWRPKEWNGYKWVDKEAPCIYVEGHNMLATGWCSKASITKPKADVVRIGAPVNDKLKRLISGADDAVTTKPPANGSIRKTPEPVRSSDSFYSDDPSVQHLYSHQQAAYEQHKESNEIALFFEMGVGKSATILAIAAYKFKKQEIDAVLVVAPNDVHVQWYKEQLPLWLQVPYDAQCFGGRGGAKECYPFDEDPDMLQVVCVNIDTFSTPAKWRDIVDWANSRKTFIILDEATVIKNVTAQRTQRLLYEFNDVMRKGKTILRSSVHSVARAILTGTPVTNGPMDMWAMMEFLRPNYFGRNWYSFQAYFGMFTSLDVNGRLIKVPLNEDHWYAIKACKEYGEAAAMFGCSEDTYNTIQAQDNFEGPYKHADELKKAIQPVSSFKLLKDCMDMPEQVYSNRLLTMSDSVRACYDSMVRDFIAEYNEHEMTALNKMTAIIRLQQISSGFLCDKNFSITPEDDEDIQEQDVLNRLFGLTDDEDIMPDEIQWIGTSNPKLDALYRDVDESAKPVIIITRFSAEAARIFNDLSAKYKCCLFTGWKRVGTIEEFKTGVYPIMVANAAVVARGFNLQNSHTILFYSNTFSLELRLQAEGRIFRIGQKEPCSYIDYIYDNSVDEKIVHALHMKRNLLDFIRTADDIQELVL